MLDKLWFNLLVGGCLLICSALAVVYGQRKFDSSPKISVAASGVGMQLSVEEMVAILAKTYDEKKDYNPQDPLYKKYLLLKQQLRDLKADRDQLYFLSFVFLASAVGVGVRYRTIVKRRSSGEMSVKPIATPP